MWTHPLHKAVWWAALAAVLAFGSPLAAQEGKRYAVLAAGSAYDHVKLEPLKFTDNDVTDEEKGAKKRGHSWHQSHQRQGGDGCRQPDLPRRV